MVRTVSSLVSIGTEKSIMDLAKKSLVGKAKARPDLVKRFVEKAQKEGFLKVYKEALGRLDEPFPLGYSATGVVVEVGKGIDEFAVGDRVAIAGSGFANHAEYNFVPENLCVRLPKKVNGYSLLVNGEKEGGNGYSLFVNREKDDGRTGDGVNSKNQSTQITNNKSTNNFISFEEGSFGMVGAIALNGIREAGLTFGENVVVIGLGLIGLIRCRF